MSSASAELYLIDFISQVLINESAKSRWAKYVVPFLVEHNIVFQLISCAR